jgi:Anti-sigma-K factor rskA
VLASVRGEANNSRVRRRGRGVPILVVIALAVAAGLYFGISPAGHSGSAKPLQATAGVQASLRRIGSRAELLVSGMPEPPIGEVYEVWLTRASGAPHPTDALFTVSRAGKASVYVPGSLRGVREITVTSEPLGGSAHPTTAPVLRVALARSR